MFDWPGNSADLTPIEEIWNIMQKKYFKLQNNKKKNFGITFVTYGMVFIVKLLRNGIAQNYSPDVDLEKFMHDWIKRR